MIMLHRSIGQASGRGGLGEGVGRGREGCNLFLYQGDLELLESRWQAGRGESASWICM